MTLVIKKSNDKLDFNYLENSELSIQISLDGFSFCILNTDLKEITAIYNYDFFEDNNTPEIILKNIELIVEEQPLLKNKFKKVHLSFKNKLSTFVPKELFDKQIVASYLQYNVKVLSNDFIAIDEIEIADFVTVYIPFVNITNYFFELYGAFEYKHSSSILVSKLLEMNSLTDPTVYIQVDKSSFEILIIKNKKLLFYNSFDLNSREDFAYFILFTFEQLQLNRETVKVILMGDIDAKNDLYKLIYKYIRNIEFLTYNYLYKSDLLLEIENHQHFVVLNQF